MNQIFAERTQHLYSAVREFDAIAKQMQKSGKKVLYASTGDPSKYDFDPPSSLADALSKAVKERHNYYADSQGDPELRKAIAEREKRINSAEVDPDNIIITDGLSEAMTFFISILCEKGTEALLPDPGYQPYISRVRFFDGKDVPYKTDEANQWQPDIRDIEKKINDKTRFLLMINPNNPTGAVYDKKTVKEIINLAGQHNLTLLSDEIYDVLSYDGKFTSSGSVCNDVPIVVFNGFSKSMLITGWRLGYVYFLNMDEKLNGIKDYMIKQCQGRLSANTPCQKAVIEGLKDDKHHEVIRSKLKKRADLSYKRLTEIPGISCVKPKGAFYIFPKIPVGKKWKNDDEFVRQFLDKEHVLVVKGSGFGDNGKNHIRITILPQEDYLNEIFDRLERFVKNG